MLQYILWWQLGYHGCGLLDACRGWMWAILKFIELLRTEKLIFVGSGKTFYLKMLDRIVNISKNINKFVTMLYKNKFSWYKTSPSWVGL